MNQPSLWYFCHPVASPCTCDSCCELGAHHGRAADIVACNLARAKRWLRWCRDLATEIVIIAPWMVDVEFGDDADPAQRERGIRGCEVTVRRCDGIILAGGHLSSGMARELEAFTRSRPAWEPGQVIRPTNVVDLREIGDEPPDKHWLNENVSQEEAFKRAGTLARLRSLR